MNLNNRKVKRIVSPLVFFFLILFVTRCEKETPRAREYPRLTATQIVNVNDSGAIFSADLYSSGTETILNHGFVWGFNREPDISNNRIYLGKPENTGIFRAEVSTALSKDQTYHVKSFVQTTERIVYGPETSFKSLGCKGPVIYGFESDAAAWGDTIKISGKNFSWVSNHNEVYLNNISCWVFKSTDTTLFCILDPKVLTKMNTVSVRLAGSSNTYLQRQIEVQLPEIADIINENVFWRDTLNVILRNFSFAAIPYVKASAFLGQTQCQEIYKTNDTLKIIIPDNIITIENELKIQVNGLNLLWPLKVKLKSPAITSFKPAEGTWGQKLSIKGRFHPDKIKNTFKVGSAIATIFDFSTDSAKIIIPSSLGARKNLVSLACNPFNIIATDTFRLSAPVIESVSPIFGPSGTEMTITGKYLNNGNSSFTSVKFGNVKATLTSVNNSTIKCRVPSGLSNGMAEILVHVGNQAAVIVDSFDVRNPVIFDFYPKSATYNDEITIKGKNLGSLKSSDIRFGFPTASSLISASDTMLVVTPSCYINNPVKIQIYTSYTNTYSSDYFTILPCVIKSVSSLQISPGQDIIIYGDNFNGVCSNDNIVLWSGKYFYIKSATKNQIIATAPYSGLIRGSAKIIVQLGGYTIYSPETVTY